MDLITILLVVLLIATIGAYPTWTYSSGWGYYPFSFLALTLVVILVLVVYRRLG